VTERREKTEKSAGKWWTAQVWDIKNCGQDLDKGQFLVLALVKYGAKMRVKGFRKRNPFSN
jgi:hypothetical protein